MTSTGKTYLHVRDLVLLPVVLLHLVLEQLHARPDECLVVTGVVLEAALAHVDDVRAHAVQEVLRVRDQDQDAFVAGMEIFYLFIKIHLKLSFQAMPNASVNLIYF